MRYSEFITCKGSKHYTLSLQLWLKSLKTHNLSNMTIRWQIRMQFIQSKFCVILVSIRFDKEKSSSDGVCLYMKLSWSSNLENICKKPIGPVVHEVVFLLSRHLSYQALLDLNVLIYTTRTKPVKSLRLISIHIRPALQHPNRPFNREWNTSMTFQTFWVERRGKS